MKNSKKCISLILSLLMVFGVFNIVPISTAAKEINASAVGATSGKTGDCTWTLDGTVLTISGNGEMGDNSMWGTAPWGTGITEVILTDGVTSIGSWVFYGCTGLTSITIPDSVTSIGMCAFYGCTGLTSITIPDSVTSIDFAAFYGCSGLTSVNIPDSVTSIGWSAFYGCTGLTSITIPDSVTRIGDGAFRDCTGLTSVKIPASVETIGEEAFGYYVASFISRKITGFTIYGYPGTAAETYANDNGFTFVVLKPGDADGDGEVTSIDVTFIQRYCASQMTEIDEATMMHGDIDSNGVLEIIDATYIQRHLAGMEIPYKIG